MALGFGFNKTKVLGSAEKFVQQGKLQNAIAEYEKVIKEDPKDLTVLNTIGDLYARVGQNEKACEYFKKVGDQYAQNGFTVKAIAIYKKLTKLPPVAPDAIIKLAELYTQQGLFNDARTHYMQVADQLLKSGDNNQAARLFQKILELDPENTATQSKLADLYIKLGKKDEARNIYYSAAESLYSRSSFDAADEALSRVLSLDPSNKGALLLRGMIASASGDSVSAVQYLEQVPDLDSRPDALRALLKAKLHSGSIEGLEALASKLVTVHNDVSGISALADWFVANHHVQDALKLYDRYADRFLSRGANALHETLYPLISRIRDDAQALTTMLRLLNKAGDSSHLTEVMELLAHSYVQQGEFAQARDLYKELSEQEPENPLHTQNYRQMLSKLGEDSAMRSLTPEEASQAFMVEELEHSAPVVHQTYDAPVEKVLEAALTDAELFVSYNVPLKAIAPLEKALPLAPRDVNLNQRLATLYVRAERYVDAVRACKILSTVYSEAGHANEAARYAEAAQKYAEQAAKTSGSAVTVEEIQIPAAAPVQAPSAHTSGQVPSAFTSAQVPPTEPLASTVQEFVLDTPLEEPVGFVGAATTETLPVADITAGNLAEGTVSGFGLDFETPAETSSPALAHEIDLSSEWEDMLTVETEQPAIPVEAAPVAAETVAAPKEISPEPVAPAPAPPPDPASLVSDKVQEIRFYIAQGFWEIAQGAIEDLRQLAPDAAQLPELEAAVAAGQAPPPEPVQPEPVVVAPADVTHEEPAPAPIEAAPLTVEVPAAAPPPSVPAAAAAFAVPIEIPEPVAATPILEIPEPVAPAPEPSPVPLPVAAVASPPLQPVEEEFILDVPDELAPVVEPKAPVLEIASPPVEPQPLSPPPVVTAAQTPVAVPPPPPAVPEKAAEDILGDFVLDLEQTLGDFIPEPETPVSLEADDDPLGIAPPVQPPPKVPVVQTPPPKAPAIHTPSPAAATAHTNGQMQDVDAALVLNDILSELQEDGGETAQEPADPETHYNLGIAFKEMGLLDEAIGELQKVCHAVDDGVGFSQPIQAFTWLAQCLVDKGVPEAAVRWYERALKIPGLDLSSRCSIYYDLGAAYESFGDKKTALANYMEVYSSNIDFRDVANRIKALKS
ncbi:MAG TPA: tetratricopeptide repeat protein [Candidatus Angelobacter sp.]|jgi:tetratricopeptide (TPR) repeat protein|nr:tetratricopeptide repeat protein [Candidatus Angelobacter sp.]